MGLTDFSKFRKNKGARHQSCQRLSKLTPNNWNATVNFIYQFHFRSCNLIQLVCNDQTLVSNFGGFLAGKDENISQVRPIPNYQKRIFNTTENVSI